MKNIKNIKASHKTRTDVLDFECESLLEVIAGRRHNGFHFSPKGKNGVQNAIGPSGVNFNFITLT